MHPLKKDNYLKNEKILEAMNRRIAHEQAFSSATMAAGLARLVGATVVRRPLKELGILHGARALGDEEHQPSPVSEIRISGQIGARLVLAGLAHARRISPACHVARHQHVLQEVVACLVHIGVNDVRGQRRRTGGDFHADVAADLAPQTGVSFTSSGVSQRRRWLRCEMVARARCMAKSWGRPSKCSALTGAFR